MTTQRRGVLVALLVLALLTLGGSVVAVVAMTSQGLWGLRSAGPGVVGQGWHGGMMGDAYAVPGDGEPVTSLDDAASSAQGFAERLGLDVGEVMEFSNGYYAELVSAGGAGATEVLIDPDSGAVGIEYGPAMMWNTDYGMHARRGDSAGDVSPADAQRLAQEWLDAARPGLTADEAEAFPGYYTLHTLRDDAVEGMLSVNDTTGAVWYHTWHGDFVGMSEGGHA